MSTMERLFKLMADRNASDLFVSVGAPINIKINGITVSVNQQVIDVSGVYVMLREILTEGQFNEFEENWECNVGKIVPGVGNFRISAFRQRGGPAFVVRYIPSEIPNFDTLSLPPVLKESVMERRGLILVVGSAGSGKSTTLTSMLDFRNEQVGGHILTVEDPIEFIFRSKKSVVNQRELGTDAKDYATALRNALRQAPDCIFIGEIRDRQTMSQALAYAQTGHLCLATLHANNAYHSLSRIISFYPLENRPALLADLSVSLKVIASQRLVRKVDSGRVPAVEVLINSRHIADMIEKGDLDAVREAMEQSLTPGSQTFEQALYSLFKTGVISQQEALSNADSANNLQWLINNASDGAKLKESIAKPMEGEQTASGATFSEFTLTVG